MSQGSSQMAPGEGEARDGERVTMAGAGTGIESGAGTVDGGDPRLIYKFLLASVAIVRDISLSRPRVNFVGATNERAMEAIVKKGMRVYASCRLMMTNFPAKDYLIPLFMTDRGQCVVHGNGQHTFRAPGQEIVPMYRIDDDDGYIHWRTIPSRRHDKHELGGFDTFFTSIGYSPEQPLGDERLRFLESVRVDRSDWLEFWEGHIAKDWDAAPRQALPQQAPPPPQAPAPPPVPQVAAPPAQVAPAPGAQSNANKENDAPSWAVPFTGTQVNGTAARPLAPTQAPAAPSHAFATMPIMGAVPVFATVPVMFAPAPAPAPLPPPTPAPVMPGAVNSDVEMPGDEGTPNATNSEGAAMDESDDDDDMLVDQADSEEEDILWIV